MNAKKGPPPRAIGKDPYLSYRFRAEIDSLEVVGFSEVSGVTAETELLSFREGGVNTHMWELAGPSKFSARLILKRGLADSDELWDWYRKVMEGKIERRNVTIKLMDNAGEEKWRWVFKKACPVKWTGPDFRAGSSEIAFESIELVHQGLAPAPSTGRSGG